MNTTHLFTLGNSHAVRLPKMLLRQLSFADNETVTLEATEDGALLIRKAVPGPYRTIEDRFAGYSGGYMPVEWDTGEPSGKELL